MGKLRESQQTSHGVPAQRLDRPPQPLSTDRPAPSAVDVGGSVTRAVHPLHAATRPDLDPALRARLGYLAWRRFEIRATDVDDIVHATLDAYLKTSPRRGIEPGRYEILVELFRLECGRFLERLGRQGREASDCHRNPRPRGIGAEAPFGPDSRLPAVARGQALWVLLEIRPAAPDVRPGHSPTDGRGRIDDPDSGVPPFVRRRRPRVLSLRAVLTKNGRVR